MYLNKVFIIGNLTRDPELKVMPSGTKICNLGIATNRYYKDKEGVRQEAAEFHNVVAFARLGELAAQYLKKGNQALVEGRMQTRSWDAQDGTKKYKTEIVADNIQFGSKYGSSTGGTGGSTVNASPTTDGGEAKSEGSPASESTEPSGEKIEYPQEEINPDDIPF